VSVVPGDVSGAEAGGGEAGVRLAGCEEMSGSEECGDFGGGDWEGIVADVDDHDVAVGELVVSEEGDEIVLIAGGAGAVVRGP